MKRLIFAVCCVLAASCNGQGPLPPTVSQPPAVTPPILPPVNPATDGPAPIPSTPISAGEHITATVGLKDPHCFYNWDASGRCRQFDVTAPQDGTLTVTMKWTGPSRGLYDPDLFLVSPSDRTWLYSHDSWPEKHVAGPVKIGMTYRVVVISYGRSLDFELAADIQP